MNDKVRTTIVLPRILRNQAKAKAALEEVDLSDVIADKLEKWLKEPPKEPEQAE